MKNMLFVADGFTGGGLETRVIEQIKILKKKRIRFYLLCSKFNPEYKKYFTEVSEALKLSFQLHSASDVLTDVDTICDFCKKHKIDYIECHPFLCTLPAALAAEKINIPISFTLHGVTSGDFIDGADYLSGRTLYHLMFSYGFDKYFAVAEYLTTLYSFLKNDSIVRNGASLDAMKYRKFKNTKSVAIASRLDVIKSQLIIDFLPDAYKSSAINAIDIYGDGDGVPMIQSFIADNHMSDKVRIKGWEKNLSGKLSSGEYMLAFGMGRVALEAMSSGTPVGILGYGGFAGLVNRSNLQDFAKNNLTSWKSSDASLETELKRFFKKPSDYIFSKKDLAIFDAEVIWQKYYDIVSKANHSENIASQKVYNLLLKNPDADILKDEELFSDCVKLLMNGERPIGAKLFSAIFQSQSDEITRLKTEVKALSVPPPTLRTKIYNRLKSPLVRLSKISLPRKPEIIAVLCTYNESLNICGCIEHLYKYVDKIVIFDDGSADNTVDLAKKYKKVVKIIQNPNKKSWEERKNREVVLNSAFKVSKKRNVWALCVDADERFEINFLQSLRKIADEHSSSESVIGVHFRELWDTPIQYRSDGIWNGKQKFIFFKLAAKMTFQYANEHHIPWYYSELSGKEFLTDYNLYHLKMIKPEDRQKRVDLYNRLDPNKVMQPIGYDYLTDLNNLQLTRVSDSKRFDINTVPEYYFK